MSTPPRAVSGRAGCLCHVTFVYKKLEFLVFPTKLIVVFLTTDWRNLNLTRQAPMGWFTPAPIHRIIMALKGRMAPDALGLGDCMASNVV